MVLYLGNEKYFEFLRCAGCEFAADISEADRVIVESAAPAAVEAVKAAKEKGLPVLGILGGFKAVIDAFGAECAEIDSHEGECEWAVIDATSPIYAHLESVIRVCRGTKYAAKEDTLLPELDCMSRSEQGDIIAVRNFTAPKTYGKIYAVNFALASKDTPDGVRILENFLAE